MIFLCLLSAGKIRSQSNSEIRNFVHSFAVGRETKLEVNNKYGNIYLASWNMDSVSIRAEVRAYAPNRARLEKMFDGVSINIAGSKYTILAETVFSQSFSMIVESFKGITGKMIPYDSKLEINYYVDAPEYIDITIENRYGDVYMENISGSFSATLSNGSFKAGSLSDGSSLNLAFCDADIRMIPSGNINSSLSEISIGESSNLSIESISSRFELRKMKSLRVDSRRDKFYIDDLESLRGDAYFTDFRINKLQGNISLITKYGNINADLIRKEFTEVNIISSFSDIDLDFEAGASFDLEIRHINSFIVLPDNFKTEKRALNEEKKEFVVYGSSGGDPGRSKLKIDANRGNIFIKSGM